MSDDPIQAARSALQEEIDRQLADLRSAGKTLYTLVFGGEGPDGAPTHWKAVNWDTDEELSPWHDMGDDHHAMLAFVAEHPDHEDVLTVMEEIQDAMNEEQDEG